MKKTVIILFIIVLYNACSTHINQVTSSQTIKVTSLLDQWHKDVAAYDFEAYFDKMSSRSFFIGTDASEVWSKQEFMSFSKPFFDKKQTWNFTPIKRNIYFNDTKQIAWFDETLDTWMGVCRGSGVLVYVDGKWKIEYYVLSLTVPNKDMNAVIGLIKERDSLKD